MVAAAALVEKELPRVVKELGACAKYNCNTYPKARRHVQPERETPAVNAAPSTLDYNKGMASLKFLHPGGAINDYYLHIHAFIDVLLSQSEMDGIRILGKPLPDQQGGGEFIVTFDWRPLSVAKAASLSSPYP